MEISSILTKQGTKARRHSIGSVLHKGLTESKSNTSGQSQSQTTVPNYLRASTGSCHDFCKYGGRHPFQEEIIGSGKKNTRSNKPPAWKDIISYDAVPKISKPYKAPLVSMDISSTSKIAKPSSERPAKPSKVNLHRQGSMEITSALTKPKVVRRQESMEISNNLTKPKVSIKPNVQRRASMEISSSLTKPLVSPKPNVRQTSMEISKPVISFKANVRNDKSVEISSSLTKPKVSDIPNLRREIPVEISSSLTKPKVSDKPNLRREIPVEISSSLTKPKGVNKAKKVIRTEIEERKDQREIGNEINIGNENEIDNGIENEMDCGEEKSIYTVKLESPKIDSDSYENELKYEKQFEETKPVLNEGIKIIFEKEGEKEIMNEDVFVEKLNECVFNKAVGTVLKDNVESMLSEPIETTSKNNLESMLSEPVEPASKINLESVLSEPIEPDLKDNVESMLSEPIEPASKNILESMLNETAEISKSDKDPNPIEGKSGSSSSETTEKSELDFESESESFEDEEELESESIEEEEELESELESESENGKIGETDGNQDSLKVSNRRRSGVIKEEEKGYKLKFKPGRVIELKPDKNTTPKRLKFRKARERNRNPRVDSGRKASYEKKSRSPVKANTEPANSVLLRHQDEQERKEGQNGLFNNVIEKTASKLVESRKSKVKALVGAFETVISLQDGKP